MSPLWNTVGTQPFHSSTFQKLGWSLRACSVWCCRGRCHGLDKIGAVPRGVAGATRGSQVPPPKASVVPGRWEVVGERPRRIGGADEVDRHHTEKVNC